MGTALAVVIAALAVALTVIGLLRLRGADEGLQLELNVPTQASATELRDYANASRPVYWIGPPETGKLEVWRTSRGLYVRYLPRDVAIGAKTARYTTIGTYPFRGAYASMQRTARSDQFGRATLAGGGIAVWRKSPGTSVYIAYPRKPYLIEVYDPTAVRARSLALSGVVQRVP